LDDRDRIPPWVHLRRLREEYRDGNGVHNLLTLCAGCHEAFDFHIHPAKWYVEVEGVGAKSADFRVVFVDSDFEARTRRLLGIRGGEQVHLNLSDDSGMLSHYPAKALLMWHARYAKKNKTLTPKKEKLEKERREEERTCERQPRKRARRG